MKILLILFLLVGVSALSQPMLLDTKFNAWSPGASGSGLSNVTAGLVGWWKVDSSIGITAIDSSPTGNTVH